MDGLHTKRTVSGSMLVFPRCFFESICMHSIRTSRWLNGFLCILISPVGTDTSKACWRNMLARAAAAFDAVEHKSKRKVVRGCNQKIFDKNGGVL